MKCHILFNGFQPDPVRSARELRGFLKLAQGLTPESAIVLCPTDVSAKDLCSVLPVPACTVVQLEVYQPEAALEALKPLAGADAVYLAASDKISAELCVRLGARTGGCGIAGVTHAATEEGSLLIRRKVYAGHMEATFETALLPCFLSVASGGTLAEEAAFETEITQVISVASPPDVPRPVPHINNRGLEDAPLLVVAGRGLGSAQGVARAEALAQALSAGFGATKAVASLGWAPMDRIIGVSGIMARPERCLVLGASGAPAFYAGIAPGQRILAVNTDPYAPILAGADLVMQCDCPALVDQVLEQLSAEKESHNHG